MPEFVVTTGLTRRLVCATSSIKARELFGLAIDGGQVPGIHPGTHFRRGEISIRPATDADLAEFGAAPRRRTKDLDQLGWEFPDIPTQSKRRKTKDPA